MKIGCNSGIWQDFQAAVPGAACYRQYRDTINDIPATWPSQQGPAGARLLSIRPNPDDLLAGKLDQQITQLVMSGTTGDLLTAWHEAPGLYPPGTLNAATVRQMHVHLRQLCDPTPVRYGNIIMGDPATLDAWTPKAAYPLHWYGFDIYMTTEMTNPDGTINLTAVRKRVAAMFTMAADRTGAVTVPLVIGETNAPNPALRPSWFQIVADELSLYTGDMMLTFFKPGGQLGGQWLPGDQATIWSLRTLATNYQQGTLP